MVAPRGAAVAAAGAPRRRGDWSAFVRRARAVLAEASQGKDDDGRIAAEAVPVVRADVAKHRPELEF